MARFLPRSGSLPNDPWYTSEDSETTAKDSQPSSAPIMNDLQPSSYVLDRLSSLNMREQRSHSRRISRGAPSLEDPSPKNVDTSHFSPKSPHSGALWGPPTYKWSETNNQSTDALIDDTTPLSEEGLSPVSKRRLKTSTDGGISRIRQYIATTLRSVHNVNANRQTPDPTPGTLNPKLSGIPQALDPKNLNPKH